MIQFLRRLRRKGRFLLAYFRAGFMGWVHRAEYREVKNFCMFIGYPRSGHSLVAALLDAHPEVVMGMEWGVLYHLNMGFSRRQIFYSLSRNAKLFQKRKHNIWTGYSYLVTGQWQGKYQRIRVIGDKMGGRTSLLIDEDPGLIDRLDQMMGIPVKWIHVIRNPFDTITTMTRRMLEKRNNLSSTPDPAELDPFIDAFFQRAGVVDELRKTGRIDMLDLYHEDLVDKPAEEIRRLLAFLGLDPTPRFLDACSSIVYPSPHRSRTRIAWTDKQIEQVEKRIKDLDFLSRYNYSS